MLMNVVSFQKSIAEWLAPYDSAQLYRQALAVDELGTGRWFLDGPYIDWRAKTGPKVLWLKGKRTLRPAALLKRLC